jgi:hypothetical protein
MKFTGVQPIDTGKRQQIGFRLENLAAAPASPVIGQEYYDTILLKVGFWNGTAWDYSAGTGNVTQSSNSTGAGKIKISNGANKDIADYAGADGLLKIVSGVPSPAVADTDYATPAGILSKVLTGLPAGTNTPITSAMTLLTALANIQAEISAAMTSIASVAKPMGGIDCSTNPNYPAGTIGDFYRVIVAGKIGGASGPTVEIGDEVHCYVTGVSGTQATVGANWTLVQANVGQASTSTLGLTRYSNGTTDITSNNASVAVTPNALWNASFARNKTIDIGDGIATSFNITLAFLGFNSEVYNVICYDLTTKLVELPDIKINSTSIDIIFAVAPATFNIRLAILGS